MPTHEQQPQPANQAEQHFRTVAVRIEENLHAQLRFIAQLSDSTVSDEIRGAIERRIASAHDDPDLIARANQAQAEIEREAATRSAAIAGFMGRHGVTGATDTAPPAPQRSRRVPRANGE